MTLNPLQKSTYLAEIFFQDLSPWLHGEYKLLCRRFFQEKLAGLSSKIETFFFEKAYESQRKKYTAPNISLGKYLSIYERYKIKIKAERLVLWQTLSLDIGTGFNTELFIEQNKALLSCEQKKYLRGYGSYLPPFLEVFEGLSFNALATQAVLAEPKQILFSEFLSKNEPGLRFQELVKFSQNKQKDIIKEPLVNKKMLLATQ